MKTNRVNELMAAMKNSFSEETYHKSERLGEMLKLQNEIVNLTFNDEHVDSANLRIYDVENHLEKLNESCGNIADIELQRFKEGSKNLCNMIKAELSGCKGETMAFRKLESLQSKNIVLKNIELNDGDHRTELDAIVITRSAVTIVEVKNTSRDIFISEDGDYYRTGDYSSLDCNIKEKLSHKEEILRKTLGDCGVENIAIRSILVFTNNRIQVHNKAQKSIKNCFLPQLTHIIDGYVTTRGMTDEEMDRIASSIIEAENTERYPAGFDVFQYKKDYAVLMSILENASAHKENWFDRVKGGGKKYNIIVFIHKLKLSRRLRAAGGANAGIVATM